MPLLYSKKTSTTTLSLWLLREEVAFFNKVLDRYNLLLPEETGKHALRKLQWLAARHLLHSVHNIQEDIYKTTEGKPVVSTEDTHLSISHSEELIAVYSSPNSCGVDIQKETQKIFNIKSKFLSPNQHTGDLTTLHLIWGAKEAMYKAYGLKKLNFKQDILVLTATPSRKPKGVFEGSITKNGLTINYLIKYEIWNDYYLVIAEETHRKNTASPIP